MAFSHSKSSRVVVNDAHLSGSISGYSVSFSKAMGEATTLLDGGSTFIPGLIDGSFSLDGRFDNAEDGIHEKIATAITDQDRMIVTVFPDDHDVGSHAYIADANPTSYEVSSEVADVTNLSFEGQPDNGVDWGHSHHALASETSAASGASVDHGSESTNGGVASLHVTAQSGTTPTLDVTIQHSSDDSTWADLITFDQVEGSTGVQYKTVSGTVDQYTRADWATGGTSPDYTFTTAFARR